MPILLAIKAAVVVSIAYGAAALLQRRSAALRHGVLAMGLIGAGLLPVFEWIAPGWGASWLAQVESSGGTAVDAVQRGWLFDVWAAGAAAGLIMLLAGLARIAWMRASANPHVSAAWQAIADSVTAECGIRRGVTLLETSRAAMPVTWGIIRPKILLPRVAHDWDDERVRAVLRHEIAHIARGDWAVHVVSALVIRLYWFLPMMWIADRRLRLEGERACDDAVLNLGADSVDYAGHLVAIARSLRGDSMAAPLAPAAARIGSLERRITAALDGRVARAPLSGVAVFLLALTTASVAVAVAGFGIDASGLPEAPLLDVQRDIMLRFGGEERRFSIVSNDVSFWRTRIEGRVELQARLNVDGSLSSVRFLEPVHPDLANAATALVRNWRREPATVRGVPVAVPIRMTVDFRR